MASAKKKNSHPPNISSYQKQADRVIVRILNQLPAKLHQDIHYLFKGKRIRSTLMFSLASRLGCPLSQIILPAAGLEVVHTISLIHDDVIDRQMIRREQPTLHSLYGNRAAVFIGDFLLYCLAKEMTNYKYGDKVIDTLYRKIAELCRGEVLQDIPTEIVTPSRQNYLKMIRQKTGSLFSYSFMVPAFLAEGKPPQTQVMPFAEECGYLFGLSFQLADDIDDLEEDIEMIRNEQVAQRDGDSPERLFSYPIMLWKEINDDEFHEYFRRPSTKQIYRVKEKLRQLIYQEITDKLHHLKAKSDKREGAATSHLYSFLEEETNKLFTSTTMK